MHVYEYLVIIFIPVLGLFWKIFNDSRRKKNFFKNFPSPRGEFLLGNVRDFSSTTAALKSLHKYTKDYGSTFSLQMGPFERVLVSSDYDLILFMLNHIKSFPKSEEIRFLAPWLGNGLAVAQGEMWKKHRKFITPAFHFKILENFVDIFESNSDMLVEQLSKIKQTESLDIHPYITRCTLNIIYETAMGVQFNAQKDELSLYLESVKDMCRIVMTRWTSFLKRYDFFFRFTEDYKIQRKSINYLYNQTDQVIKLKREIIENQGDYNKDTQKKKVFLDLLMEATFNEQIFSHEELRDEVNTFMFAGHDTTASASSFILYCLAMHKSVQDKVLMEQKDIFGDTQHSNLTFANLHEMKYLDCVIKESLRLYTTVPLLGRKTIEDVNYKGMLIPKGVIILIFCYGVHMNPKYYPDPEKFDPGRFESTQEHSAYIPFGAGPRICIGQKYAMLEIKSLVSKIVRNFELSPAIPNHNINLASETILKPLNGVKIGFKLR